MTDDARQPQEPPLTKKERQRLRDQALRMEANYARMSRATEKLKTRAMQFDAILSVLPDGFFSLDKHGRLLEFNNGLRQMMGRSKEAILQMGLTDLDGNPAVGSLEDRLEEFRRSGFTRYEGQLPRKNGQVMDVEISLTWQPEEDHFIGFIRDISQGKQSSAIDHETRLHLEETSQSLAETLEEYQTSEDELHATTDELQLQNEELRAMHSELEESRQHYQGLFQFASYGYMITDTEGTLQEVNRAALNLLGLEERSAVGKDLAQFVARGSQKEFRRRLKKICKASEGSNQEWELKMLRGGQSASFTAALAVTPIHSGDGDVSGVRWLLRDITERKQMDTELEGHRLHLEEMVKERTAQLQEEIAGRELMEEELRRSEKKYRELVKYAPVGIYQIDFRTRKFTSVNEVVIQQTGYSREELFNMSPFDILDAPSQALFGERMRMWLAGEKPEENVEYRVIAKDGHEIFAVLNVNFTRDEKGQPLGATVVGYDITERKRAEEELLAGEHRIKEILESISDGFWAVDDKWRFIYMNKRAAQNLGYQPDELIGKDLWEVFPTIAGTTHEKYYRQAMETRQPGRFEINGVLTKDTYSISIYPSGKGISVYWQNITDQKQAEEALHLSEARYRRLVEASPDAIFVNRDKKIVLANKAALDLFGAETSDQILGKEPYIFFHPAYHELIEERIKTLFAGGSLKPIEVKVLRLDGKLRTVEATAVLTSDAEGPAAQVILHDVTERKESEGEQKRLNRTLKALSNINQAMVHATDEVEYMNEVCRIVVEDCGHVLAWIGLAEQDEAKTVRPVASAGFEEGYLETLQVTWADTERGRGPTGTAIRTGKVSACPNMLSDPRFTPWRSEAMKRGYAASIALPLSSEGNVFGAIMIYSREPDPFTPSELDLLGELASDLAYGISMIRTKDAQAKAEAALRESESRFRTLADASFEGLVIHEDGVLLDVNARITDILGYTPAELIGKSFWEFIDAKYLEAVRKAVRTSTTSLYEVELIHKDGRRVPMEVVGRPLEWKGKVVRVAALRDITERKKAEAALRESEIRYRSLFDSMSEGFALHEMIFDKDGQPLDYRFLEINAAFEQLTGLQREKVVGHTFKEVLPHESPTWLEVYANVALTGEPVHFDNYSPALNRHYGVHAYRPAEGQFATIFMDITERKKMEAELQKAREEAERHANELDVIFNSIPDGIIVYDTEGRALQSNRVTVDILGFDPAVKKMGELANTLSTRTMDGQLLKLADSPTARALSGKSVSGDRYIIHNARQEDVIVSSSSSPLWVGERIAGAVTVMQDVTEKYKAEEIQAWLASFPELNPNPIAEMDASGVIRYMNPTIRRLFPDLEARGTDHPWLENFQVMAADISASKNLVITREVLVGEDYYHQSASLVPQNGRIRTYGFEITKRKQAQKALERSNERLELMTDTVSRLLASPEPQKVVEELCQKVLAHLDCHIFVNYLVDEQAGRLHLNACGGIQAKMVRRLEWLDIGAFVCGQVAQKGERIVAEDIPVIRDPRTDLVRGMGVQAYACHPLIVQGKVIGTLSFGTRTRPHFSEDDLALMKAVADHVAIAMGRYQVEQAVIQARDELEQRVLERTQELRSANEQLRTERQRFNDVLDDLPAYLILLTPDYHVSFANRYFEEHFGKSEGRRCYEYLFHRTEPCEICVTYRTLKENRPVQWEWTGPDQRNYDIHDFPFTDVDGSNLILEMGIDITERKQAEAELDKYRQHLEELVEARTNELQKERANLQKIFDVVNVGMLLVNETGSVKRINNVIRQWTGEEEGEFELEDLQPGDALDCLHAIESPGGCGTSQFCPACRIRKTFETVIKTGKARHGVEVETILVMNDEKKNMWLDISADPLDVDGQPHVILALSDITARKTAEHALLQARDELEERVNQRTQELSITNDHLLNEVAERRRAEEELRLQTSAMEAAANGIIITDRNGTIEWCNPAFTQMTGYSYVEVMGQNPRLLKSGKQDQKFYERLWQTLLSGQVWHGEIVNKRKSGELYTEEEIITPVLDEQGEISHFIAVKQDITSRKESEEALRLANSYNRSLLESSIDTIATITPGGKIGDVNSAAENVTGWTRQELIGTDFHSYFSDPDKARLAYEKVFDLGSVHDYELEIRHKGGKVTPVLYNGSVYRDEAGKVQGVLTVARDITDRKQFEAQLMQAEKHAVIGRMVGSVTHEINNPLQTIKNCLYLIQQDTPAESPIAEPLDMASSETARLTDIVGQLRELYRPRTDVTDHPHEIMDILEEVHALLTPHLNNSRVRWNILTGMQRCYINCIRDQILEVFLNISMNAIEAMKSDGGILSLDMAFKGEQVGVIFSDTGPGVAPEIMSHIFEPFTTTKNSGLGLGLSISYGIVQRHGGQITVENCPEGGAMFTIWLPVASKSKKKENTRHASKR
jgi:PAS domain S-box-containing protein